MLCQFLSCQGSTSMSAHSVKHCLTCNSSSMSWPIAAALAARSVVLTDLVSLRPSGSSAITLKLI